jgi:hypothetical protein
MLLLHQSAPPDRVLARAFSAVDPASREPASDPVATYQCSRFAEPKCAFELARSDVRLVGLPTAVLAPGYLVVFCTWSVPPERQVDAGGAEVAASWLFRIDLD